MNVNLLNIDWVKILDEDGNFLLEFKIGSTSKIKDGKTSTLSFRPLKGSLFKKQEPKPFKPKYELRTVHVDGDGVVSYSLDDEAGSADKESFLCYGIYVTKEDGLQYHFSDLFPESRFPAKIRECKDSGINIVKVLNDN